MYIWLYKFRFFLKVQKCMVSLLLFVLFFTDIQALLTITFLPTVEKAFADAGDFSIFRNNASSTTLTTTPIAIGWDTTVLQSTNIPLLADNSSIDLVQAGKYLVLYNVWASENGGTNRRSVETYLTLDGARTPYGVGAGYLRDLGGDLDMYNSGAAILDVTAGQDLKVVAARDDANAAAGVALRTGKNGVTVLRMKDDLDYLRIYKTSDTVGVDANITFTDVVWDANDEIDTGSFGFTNGTSNITLAGADGDRFLVTSNVGLRQIVNSNNRLNYEMRLTLDGAEIPGSRVTSYVRGNPNSNGAYTGTLVYSGIIQKTSSLNQTFNIEVRKESVGSTATTSIVGSETALAIVKLPNTGKYVSLTSTTTSQSLSNTRGVFNWNEQLDIDSAVYGQSTTTNNSRVTFNEAGDYLFFSTAYTSRTTSGTRSSPVIEWRLDGSALPLTYGGHGSFNRGDQGANDAFTSGSSGGVVLDGITSAQYLEVTHIDESANTNNVFPARQIAVQGVRLAELFITDIDVSATGTHALNYDIPQTNVYNGGAFAIESNNGAQTVNSITITESGTVDGSSGLENIELWYDVDTVAPFDCTGEAYGDGEAEIQFGSTDSNGFSGVDGTSAFSGSVSLSASQSMCVYVVYDVTSSASDGQTVKISINNPTLDVGMTGAPTISPSSTVVPLSSTTLQNAELTLTNYRWLNDDGIEGSATAIEVENTPTIGFANGTIRRLRTQVDATGSTSSFPTNFQLDYATKTAACNVLTAWDDVGTVGGAWDMSNTVNLTDGNNATNIGIGAGGVSDPGGASFLTTNGGLRDINSITSALTLTNGQFVEFEFAIEPTVFAPQGNTYCFRLSDAGTPLRNYTNYAEGTISADIDVSASSSQVTSLDINSIGQYVGGTFVIKRPGTDRTITDITVTETGTIDGLNNLDNIQLWYDLDTTTPFDCTGETYTGVGETQFGITDTTGFSSANGSSTFSGTVVVSNSQTVCGYVVLDVGTGAIDGETINIEISDPSVDVAVVASTVGPSTSVSPTGSTTVAGPILTQTHYHWRNDNGDETNTGATSASDAIEDTGISEIVKESTQRVRLQVSNEGSVATPAIQYILEYGTKVTTCSAVNSWINVGNIGGAFDMSLSANITDGNTTNVNDFAFGAMTEENITFVGTGALRETEATSSAIVLSATQFTELEYAIEATIDAGDGTTYCFRVSDSGNSLNTYTTYPELTTREKQDFFIQRGTATVSGTGLTLIAGVDYTAPASTSLAFIRITNSQMTGAGDNSAGGTQNADDVTAYISNPGNIGTSVTISRPATALSNTRVSWEIIEYIGIVGADNEMIVRDVGTVTYGATLLNATGTTVANVTDDSNIVVFITGQLNPSENTTNYNDGISTAAWNATSSVPVFTRGDADSIAAGVSYAVVEYTGANWKIQRVEHTYSAAGVDEIESVAAVVSRETTFLHAQKRVGNNLNGLDELGHQVVLSSIGAVSFRLRSGATTPADQTSVAWVIENTQTGTGAMSVYRSNNTITSGGAEPESNIVGITGTVRMSNASLFVTNDSSGAGTAFPRPMLGATLMNTTQYELWNSDTGQNQDFSTEVVEWPVAEISIRQNYYRFYDDNDLLDPTDPWPLGISDLGENTSITGADNPLGEGERVRIRMSVLINNATLPQATQSYKLQFGRKVSTCSAISTWTDLGDPGSGTIWRGYSGSITDGTELATSTPAPGTLNISVSDVAGSFENQNNSIVNPYAVNIGEDAEYDWLLEHNGATQLSDYCFRMVKIDGTELDGYNNYPTLRTTGYTPIIANWRWYDDATNTTPTIALAAENVTPTEIAPENEIKLRLTATEVEGAPGSNVKFQLQYSEYADFSVGVYTVTATSSCNATSTWCYVNAAGVDNVPITTALLSDADLCIAGVGNGCGTHNETATSTSSHAQPSLSSMEFEFAIKSSNPRVSAVYYFRLYDVTNDVEVSASSSYPSLVTEGASLTFTIGGLPSGTVTEGVITDVTTTPISVPFGSLPIDTEYTAAHRISINTNATEGYQVLSYATQGLLDSYGTAIDVVSGTNAVPTNWSPIGCVVSATGCFGYHAGDDVLFEGSTRFSPIDSYAAFEINPQEIMYSSLPVNESADMVYKIQVSNAQPAGIYESEIVYLAIPVF